MIFYLIRKLLSLVGLFDKEAKKIHITCVGVSNSKRYGSCPGASLDAKNIYNYCKKHISKDVKLLVDGSASKASVTQSFLSGINSNLNILFYSGHGGQGKATDKSETDGLDEYLCLYDTMMKDNEIWNIVMQCKGRVFLIFDCCHSGTMYRSSDSGFMVRSLPRGSKINMMCWSGCPDNSYSYGGDDGGVFTNSILMSLNSNKYRIYKDLFKRSKAKAKSSEVLQITELGSGWNVRAFK